MGKVKQELVRCPGCGARYSARRLRCTACGDENPRLLGPASRGNPLSLILAAALGLVVAAVVYSLWH
jgi:hypothetical protein